MSAATQLSALSELISPKTGIIRKMVRRVGSAVEPPLPIIYDSRLSNFDFKNGTDLERGACGKGVTDAAAQIGAIGEAVEHYCASHPNVKSLRRAKIEDLDEAIAPTDFVLYSEEQYSKKGFKYVRWTPESEIPWLPVRELPDRRRVWVPAALVYLNYTGQKREDFLCPPTSSGSAAGPDLDYAILGGILEMIERDAFLVTWMNRLPVPGLDFSKLGGTCGVIRDHYARYGVETRAFLLATDLPVYAVMAAGIDHTGSGPTVVVGLGCDWNVETALRKALFEVCQVRPAETMKFRAGDAAKLNQYSDIHTLEEHALYFTRRDHLHEMDFLLARPASVAIGDLPAQTGDLSSITKALNDIGSRVVYADVTTPDLEELPIRVVRSLVTQLQPIAFGFDEQRLGGRRLYELPGKLGYSAGALNECPHPLA